MRSIFLVLLLLLPLSARAEELKIVASIRPLHSLVAGVMAGAGTPALLLDGPQSPHGASLKPSQMERLAQADIVFYISPTLEGFMNKALAILPPNVRQVPLIEAEGLTRLPFRDGDDDGHDDHEHGHGSVDPHIWLSPANARAMTAAIASALTAADPAHAALYAANAAAMDERLAALDRDIAARMAPAAGRSYIALHDAWAYFDHAYGLPLAGTAAEPGQEPGAKRVAALRRIIATQADGICIVADPHTAPRLTAALLESGDARIAVLDPLGSALPPGPDLYFALLRETADALAACLNPLQ